MEIHGILFTLVKNMSVIVTFAYLFSKNDLFGHVIERKYKLGKFYLILLFVPLSIAGTYLSFGVLDALANIRSIGAIVGGIYGGPLVGVIVGLISGFHRWTLGGFTAFSCAVGVVGSGLIGGLYHQYIKGKSPETIGAMGVTTVALVVEMALVLLLSKPFDQAWHLVKIITIPMTMSNVVGVGIFVNILESARVEIDHVKAMQSRKALNIANQTLPYLRKGLAAQSAARVVELIYQETDIDAVAITDNEKILAYIGVGSDHHLPGQEIRTRATQSALVNGGMVVVLEKDEIGCSHEGCLLNSAVVVPLWNNEQLLGVLKLYRVKGKSISSSDIELARGISCLLANQIEIARLSEQAQLTIEAELKALQTQINPHFLFNSINTIVSYCRTEPMKARSLLLRLAEVFRYTLKSKGYLCALEEEIKLVQDYMEIEQARFGERINLEIDVAADLFKVAIPRLSLQPLVENAVKHGVSKISGKGRIKISARKIDTGVEIMVIDNGVGIPDDKIDSVLNPGQGDNLGIGLSNVHTRLINLFGEGSGIRIESGEDLGTSLFFVVPENLADGDNTQIA